MSQWAHEYPEDYEERMENLLEAADNQRKYAKEHGLCPICLEELPFHKLTCSRAGEGVIDEPHNN